MLSRQSLMAGLIQFAPENVGQPLQSCCAGCCQYYRRKHPWFDKNLAEIGYLDDTDTIIASYVCIAGFVAFFFCTSFNNFICSTTYSLLVDEICVLLPLV